jgi:hypothetical protein
LISGILIGPIGDTALIDLIPAATFVKSASLIGAVTGKLVIALLIVCIDVTAVEP